MPVVIQRKRTKGWRMPANTVYVGRPTVLGNPFRIREAYRLWLIDNWIAYEYLDLRKGYCLNRAQLDMYRARILHRIPELRGKNLCCWCADPQKCHASVLLELANQEE